MEKAARDWWKKAVIYQIYPKSFKDTNGDGLGDLPGVIGKLDYLADLGVDIIWLSPVYKSPQKDNGYDISDYEAINPHYGTMADMEKLIAEAKKRGITIMMDLVLNHTSHEHEWFKEAQKGEENPYYDYYIWRDGVPGTPPNEMKAAFGGSAWTYNEKVGKYYYNQFSPWQPDLNWENPKVREEIHKMIRFWADKGVGGFRLDVVDNFGKEPDNLIGADGPKLHDYLKELRKEAFIEDNMVTVGEAWSANVENTPIYTNPDGSELSMMFPFEPFILNFNRERKEFDGKWDLLPITLSEIKKCFADWQVGLYGKGWVSLFMENHDFPRIVSRWGNDKEYRNESAKMLAVMMYGMRGTPCIYQGQEIGMSNIRLPIENYDDIETKDAYQSMLKAGISEEDALESIYKSSRDNGRTPMQWSDAEFAGFSNVQPWLPVNPNYKEVNVEKEEGEAESILNFYKELLKVRKKYDVFTDGTFTLLDPASDNTFIYMRDNGGEHVLIMCNFTDKKVSVDIPTKFTDAELLISNYNDIKEDELRPYEAKMLYYKD